jgi:hypothetical protein
MVSIPAGNEEVVRAAMPPVSAAVTRTDEPFLKVMSSPFGGAPAIELTVAVKVIA